MAILLLISTVFVGWEIIERRLFPDMSTGLRHFLLTVKAVLTTTVGCLIVYRFMRRQNQQLSRTAGEVSRLLSSYLDSPNRPEYFTNPHRVHCREVLDCGNEACPMYHDEEQRCWQVMALMDNMEDRDIPRMGIDRCRDCLVFRASCPDKLTELGENFNNLMFLLRMESERVERMRGQMVEKEKMASIGLLASGLAHEIGNPLSSISSVIQVLQRSGLNGSMKESFDLIQTHIQRIAETVRQLSKLARPTADCWEKVDVGSILQEAVSLVAFDPRARNIKIRSEMAPALPKVYALPNQIEQVFINLLINALDAMEGRGELIARTRHSGSKVIVEIQDTGYGIPEEAGRKIFEPFFTTKDPGRGTGLGLAVSYSMVQKHRGTIDYSTRKGEGTLFTIELPILNRAPGS